MERSEIRDSRDTGPGLRFAPSGLQRLEFDVIASLLHVIASAAKQSILSLWRNGLLRGACHRARIRATRWLAMTARAMDLLRGACHRAARMRA